MDLCAKRDNLWNALWLEPRDNMVKKRLPETISTDEQESFEDLSE